MIRTDFFAEEYRMKTHVLENEYLKITVSDEGAELISVLDRETGRERIWTADPKIWNRHSPVLFPFIGRVTEGKYRVDGIEYSMKTQHGFARDLEFECIEESRTTVRHCLVSSERTREIYPFSFRLTVQHRICDEHPRQVEVVWTVENTGEGRMYYSIGGHPGFLLPAGVKKEDCYLSFPGRESLTYFGANSAGFALPDERKELKLDDGFVRYRKDIPDTWIFEDQNIETVEIANPDRKPYVTMKCGQLPMLAVWANPDGPFVCLEPWAGRTDDAGFTGSLDQKKGMEQLECGGSRTIGYSMEFHRDFSNS